ncbi:MAG: glutathione S-transferase family protein [Alphaproteobacteria bacterium]|nr:glutathione S-transferase family protein [Alphaproteobacteria bacterium]
MIDLYSVPTTNGQRVHVMLEETGLPYTPHFVDLHGGKHLEPDFLAKNPFGRVPAIIDRDGPNGNELTLFEGHSILFYLAEKSGQFYPDDLAVRAEIHTWMSAISANIGPAFSALFWFGKIAPEHSQMTIDRYTAEAHRGLRALDTHIEGRDYFAGDAYSIADIHAYPVAATSAAGLSGGLDDYPSLARWKNGIAERDAVKRGMALFSD